MSQLATVWACIFLGAAVACSGGNDSPSNATSSGATSTPVLETTGPPTEISTADLEIALLRLEDLPAGWAKEPEGGTEDSDATCGLNLKTDFQIAESALRLFSQGETGPFLVQDIVLYDPGEAETALTELQRVLETCTEDIDVDEFGAETVSDLRSIDFPDFGDGSVALRVEGREANALGLFQANFVIIRRNAVLLVLIHISFDDGGPDVSETKCS